MMMTVTIATRHRRRRDAPIVDKPDCGIPFLS
jgi:hypothetical protein